VYLDEGLDLHIEDGVAATYHWSVYQKDVWGYLREKTQHKK
jgi:hypothetical protein